MRRAVIAAISLLGAVSLSAQQQFPTLERGLQPGKLYQFGAIDNVNVFNGNVTIGLPVGMSYPIDGGLAYQLTLSYNSNLWDLEAKSECFGLNCAPALLMAADEVYSRVTLRPDVVIDSVSDVARQMAAAYRGELVKGTDTGGDALLVKS